MMKALSYVIAIWGLLSLVSMFLYVGFDIRWWVQTEGSHLRVIMLFILHFMGIMSLGMMWLYRSGSLSLQIQAHPSVEEIGALCSLIQREVSVSVTPPGDNDQ